MKKIIFQLLCLFSFCLVFSQQNPREIIKGQIVADSLSVENVKVLNKNTNTFAVSDVVGVFYIHAREKDTLVFSSQTFDSKELILLASDFKVNTVRIKLDVFVNALDEVVISPHSLTGNLETDNKNIKITQVNPLASKPQDLLFEDDEKTSPTNKLIPGYVDTRYMMDFKKLGKKFLKLFKGNDSSKPKEIIYMPDKIFPEAVQQNLPDSFFRETLKLDKNEVGLFLTFCENDPRANQLLNPRRKFELIDFLIEKNKEYEQFRKE